ncbi:SGNH/GDSL hydrolase family protein [Streptomyces sp. L2]|uniref:SGNH/GDSL hydrolase family protein n=1 Tax=Streptomyces sp. L2 TaxID=2162665 RepID=UPI001F50F52B|nr:SGNH/GDSL hydrolase family protein [Streptomyces sp. L2]
MTAAADADGLKILVADSSKAYSWKTAAVLNEPGMPADSWIGNQCVMDHDHAAVVYAPRTFQNKPDLMQGGAFAAVVDLATGRVTKLPFTASLAYFDPACNPATRTAAFTAFRDMNDAGHTRTRVVSVNTSGKVLGQAAAKGEVTSAVPVKDGTVASLGHHLVHLGRSGKVKNLLTTGGVPFDIHPIGDGNVAFVERDGTTKARARVWKRHGTTVTIATGTLGDLDLKRSGSTKVFLTGHPTGTPQVEGSGITPISASADTDISSQGRLAVDPVLTPGMRAGIARIKNAGRGFTKTEGSHPTSAQAPGTLDSSAPVTVTSTATTTGTRISQSLTSSTAPTGHSRISPALTAGHKAAAGGTSPLTRTATAVSNDPTDPDRWCAVSRNDVHAQALQPTPNQVEWAVDMAIRGDLRGGYLRQGGYRLQTGLLTIDPQGLFKPPTLLGGGRIPANVMLGIMAQESNLWQAERGVIPGQMGNPLAAVDGYYGHKTDPDNPDSYWKIDWTNSDCGYGVGQVTDGMRLAGHEKTGETSLSPQLQKAVAIDYATNIAASMKILADKWNEVHKPGQKVTVNNDDPSRVENWFTAVWNYNLGFNPPAPHSSGPWGLGWYNNPANPIYKKSWNHPFMDTDVDGTNANHDAAHPQDWPYEEKVMGWSAWSIDTGYSYATSGRQDWPGESGYSSAGFRPAWWLYTKQRSQVSPPINTFCNGYNNCNSTNPPDCHTTDCYAQYWWHAPNATWKSDCDTSCGHELIKYKTLVQEPGRGTRLQYGTPQCTGAPASWMIITSLPDGTPTWTGNNDCDKLKSAGSFKLSFTSDTSNHYEAKADLHQVGGGYGGHFWYAHARNIAHLGGDSGLMTIRGIWKLNQRVSWARVLVHLPDTGAQTRQAAYVVGGSDSTSSQRIVEQRGNRWVSLGAFHFTGTPSVTLTNATDDGTADEDIAWDTVAFQALPGKPNHSVVAMGDSYSSGEGASEGNKDYYPESNYRDDNTRDACHRSRQAWSRQAKLPGEELPTSDLDDSWSARMDYHLIACSGARTYNVLGVTQKNGGEIPQIDQGYLDNNTTLVTISIGGNDARFGDIVQKCLISFGVGNCGDKTFGAGDTDPYVNQRDDKFIGQPLKTAVPGIINEIVRPDIVKTLKEIHINAPDAKVVLMGYPPLISDSGSCLRVGVGAAQLGLSADSTNWLNNTAGTLATAMQAAVDDVNQQGQFAWYSNPATDFAGKGVCGDPEQVHGIVKTLTTSDNPLRDWPILRNYGLSAESFHPKIGGARLYANALERVMAGMSL